MNAGARAAAGHGGPEPEAVGGCHAVCGPRRPAQKTTGHVRPVT